MRLRLRIQGELSILQIAQFVKRGNKNFYTTLPISDYSLVGAQFAPARQMRQTAKPGNLKPHFSLRSEPPMFFTQAQCRLFYPFLFSKKFHHRVNNRTVLRVFCAEQVE